MFNILCDKMVKTIKKYLLFSIFLCCIYNISIAAKTDSTKLFAQSIIDNKVNPTDDDFTFDCLEKLNSKNIEERKYYFDVLKVILIKSDGALSEALGAYLLKYIDKYPDEAIRNYNTLDTIQKDRFIGIVSYELSFEENAVNSKEFIDLYFQKIAHKINASQLDEFNLFKQALYVSFKDMYMQIND